MKIKKYLTILIYLLLLLACTGIVMFIGRLAEPSLPEPPVTNSSEQENDTPACPPDDQRPNQELPEETAAAGPGETIARNPNDSWWKNYVYDPMPAETDPEETEAPYMPPTLMLATDLHYYSAELTDGGAAFEKKIAGDDGKTLWYSDEMVDALLEEALYERPSALILAGDITFYGEKENHLRLAEKLQYVQEQGVQILVIPGNHDINSHNAAFYYGEEAVPAETVSAAEFADIYNPFGYAQAISRDEHSLSYIYGLDENHWAMMLDTCQYDPVNLVNGRLSPETLEWIREQLDYANDHEIMILPAGHHNLLRESRLYTFDCTIENHADLTWLLQQYQLPVYLSGHLHAQRIKRYQEQPGIPSEVQRIYEIVLTPYCIPECRYGVFSWDEEGGIDFQTRTVSVSRWAKRHGINDENLLQFDELAPLWTKQIIKEQVLKTLFSLPEEQKEAMAALYADIYYDYIKGNQMDHSLIEQTEAWQLWERMAPDNVYKKEIHKMAEDCKTNHLEWSFYSSLT